MSIHFCPYCMTPIKTEGPCPVCGKSADSYLPAKRHLPLGTLLDGRYQIGGVIGEGGFGITYIGRDIRLDIRVAVKEYCPADHAVRSLRSATEIDSFIGESTVSFERGKQRFLNEARIMARMDKMPAAVSVRDYFEENNTAYIVMEYVEGVTLRSMVEEHGQIPPDELFLMIKPLFPALSEMHRNGLIHRDISPDNIMWSANGVRLLDFGSARYAEMGLKTLTVTFRNGYVPVEQYQHKGQGPWTDVYGLCATIYFCLVGSDPPHALDRITEDGILLPSKLGIPISADQEKALLKGLRLQPRRRFQTIEELKWALYA